MTKQRKLTRRAMGRLAAGAAAASASAQERRPEEPPAGSNARPLSGAIASFPVPMSTEPCFVFKP